MRRSCHAALLALPLLFAACGRSPGSGAMSTSGPNAETRIVAVDVTNTSSLTADVYVAGRLTTTLPPNASTRIDLQPGTQAPRVYAIEAAGSDPNHDPRKQPRPVKLSVRRVYERVPS